MFSLITTLVSIGLVALLALAAIFYGGDAFKTGSDKAAAARVLNEGQQVRGALTLYVAQTGDRASSVDNLVSSQALKVAPADWSVIDGYAYKNITAREVCLAANQKMGVDVVPLCTDSQYAGQAICCTQPTGS